jgi:hypothetical protein
MRKLVIENGQFAVQALPGLRVFEVRDPDDPAQMYVFPMSSLVAAQLANKLMAMEDEPEEREKAPKMEIVRGP